MATVLDFQQAQKRLQEGRKQAKIVSFYSASFRKGADEHAVVFNVFVEDGDSGGLIAAVIQNFGIFSDDGEAFLPWPCAYIEVKDWDGTPMKLSYEHRVYDAAGEAQVIDSK